MVVTKKRRLIIVKASLLLMAYLLFYIKLILKKVPGKGCQIDFLKIKFEFFLLFWAHKRQDPLMLDGVEGPHIRMSNVRTVLLEVNFTPLERRQIVKGRTSSSNEFKILESLV